MINDTIPEGSGVANGVNAAIINSVAVRTAQRDVWYLNFETQVQMEVERWMETTTNGKGEQR